MLQHQKVKSAPKKIMVAGEELSAVALETVKTVSDIVGATLGPGGRPVMLERYEYDSPVFVTKDGVTVFRALGFADPVKHAIMECFRDAASRTAADAGDGTTTAAVFGAAVTQRLHDFCAAHPRVKPQRAVRELERLFTVAVEPALKDAARFPNLADEDGKRLLKSVARMSANGDDPLAMAVMECYDVCGDAGHVAIVELNGPSRYEVEAVDGFSVATGYESAGPFYSKFINDAGRQLCALERPIFVLYQGEMNDVHAVFSVLSKVGDAVLAGGEHVNVVLVAAGFNEKVLGMLAANMDDPRSINPFPLRMPRFGYENGGRQFLDDLAAVTGAKVLDPVSHPLDQSTMDDYGPGVDSFEASRWKSVIYGHGDPDAVLARVADLQVHAANPASELDLHYVNERLGRLTGGIARLKVFGSSAAETREKRDRAEDAVCAVRGAIKRGCLPGGGWGLLRAQARVLEVDPPDPDGSVARDVLAPALEAPLRKMLENCGLNPDEVDSTVATIGMSATSSGSSGTYDAMAEKFVDGFEAGVLDSLPAVVEAVRNGISVAGEIGTLGGVVVFHRDRELERTEAREAEAYKRDASEDSPADQRG